MAGANGAVVRRLHLGRILRELREHAGLSLEVAAPALDWSSSKLSRIERAPRGDTKARSRASHVHPAAAWAAFLTGVRAGEFTPR